MTFDPGYCPESVDFVIANDLIVTNLLFGERTDQPYARLGAELGIGIVVRQFSEEDFYRGRNVESLTEDSVILLHGRIGNWGADTAKLAADEIDSRMIITYDCVEVDYARIKAALGYVPDEKLLLPCSPELQISLVENSEYRSELWTAEGWIKQYFKALAALRGEE